MARTSTLTKQQKQQHAETLAQIVAVVLELPERFSEPAREQALVPRKVRLGDQLTALRKTGLKLACEPVNTGATIDHLPIYRLHIA